MQFSARPALTSSRRARSILCSAARWPASRCGISAGWNARSTRPKPSCPKMSETLPTLDRFPVSVANTSTLRPVTSAGRVALPEPMVIAVFHPSSCTKTLAWSPPSGRAASSSLSSPSPSSVSANSSMTDISEKRSSTRGATAISSSDRPTRVGGSMDRSASISSASSSQNGETTPSRLQLEGLHTRRLVPLTANSTVSNGAGSVHSVR